MALEAHFDGSKDPGSWEDSRFVTLAGFAADDEWLGRFEEGWKAVLEDDSRRPKAQYLHMRELNSLEKEFSWRNGWNRTKTSYLLVDLLKYLSSLDKGKFRMFAATLDMDAYRRVTADGIELRSPIRICNDFCCNVALAWYFRDYPGLIHSAHFFFDPKEPFEQIFREKCLAEKSNELDAIGLREEWGLIKTITSVLNAKEEWAMQCADLLAWAHNRRMTAEEGGPWKYIHHWVKAVAPTSWRFVDEAALRNYPMP
jgi:hypothetical protein